MQLLIPSLLVPLLAPFLCSAEYYHVAGDGFNQFIGDSNFHVEAYSDVSVYGVPPPPGGENNSAMYLTDLSLFSETPHSFIPSIGQVQFHFTFYCGGGGSELEIRMSYPWQGDMIYLCGPKSDIEQPGHWVTGSYTKNCLGSCSALEIWFAGISASANSIVGLYILSFTTDGSTFPPELTTPELTTPEPTTTEPTTLKPTTTEPTTPEPTTPEPTTPEPTTPVPTTTEPISPEPTTLELTTPEPTTPVLTTTEPTTTEPTTTKTTTPEPTTPEPTTKEPTTSKPTTPEPTTPEPTMPGYWPNGQFGLPRSIRGCPDTKVNFETGWVEQDTEGDNEHSSSYMWAEVNETRIKKQFCIKATPSGGSGPWPAGNYCIYRYGGSCPSGFNQGKLEWDDRNLNGNNTSGGTRPDGTYGVNYTKVNYCCRSDGSTGTYIELPTEDPFILISNAGACQRVQDMRFHPQYIKYDTEDINDDSMAWGDHPYIGTSNGGMISNSTGQDGVSAMDIEMHYCYYY